MNYPLTIFVLLPIVSLIVIGYQRPTVVKSVDFRFARLISGWAVFLFALCSVIPSLAVLLKNDTLLNWAVFSSSLCWIFIIFALRGVFEVLAHGRPRD